MSREELLEWIPSADADRALVDQVDFARLPVHDIHSLRSPTRSEIHSQKYFAL